MNIKHNLITLSLILATGLTTPALAHDQSHSDINLATSSQAMSNVSQQTLQQIINIALEQDASRAQLMAQSQATLSSGQAKATLMDPTIKLGFSGIPVDSFRLDQDPMSNVSLGIMQKFDRGDTIELQSNQAHYQSHAVERQASAREREVIATVTTVWIELGYNQKTYAILQQQKQWLSQLVESLSANYALGLTESQDVISTQLKVSQLEQKLVANLQMQQKLRAQLSEWLGHEWLQNNTQLVASNQLNWSSLDENVNELADPQMRYTLLMQHPIIQSIDASVESAKTQVAIAEEAYAPQFGLEVMYAHREANNMRGEPAPDMVSAYLTMDIPLFTGNKQDKALEAAQYQVGASQSQRDAWLSRLEAQLSVLLSDREHTQQRIQRFHDTLLKQAQAQLDTVERGYQNNRASFSDIVTSSTSLLTIELELQRLITDLNLTNNQITSLIGDDLNIKQLSNTSAARY
ncbi:TolC family protein [Vibrio marinisediminis]|uniref:TolC family protein n=1 Tax=Vibrio marinisediminis TaxID=2758441 RepID=UPI0034D24B77